MMRKLLCLILIACLLFTCAAAEGEKAIAPADIPLCYGVTPLDVPVYSDGKTLYVPLEALMEALGGEYKESKEQIAIAINGSKLPALVPASSGIEPSTSWAYLAYYLDDRYGYTTESWLANFSDPLTVVALVDKTIEKSVDVDKFLAAIDETCISGCMVYRKLEQLGK